MEKSTQTELMQDDSLISRPSLCAQNFRNNLHDVIMCAEREGLGMRLARLYIYAKSNIDTGPMEESVGHFWRMVWDYEIPTILMLTQCIEAGKVYKWKNHFSEMKRDVGMSLHEKEGEQEDAYTETGSH